MIKKIFSSLVLFVACLIPNIGSAQIITIPDSEILGFNCSNGTVICYENNLTIKDIIYVGGISYCGYDYGDFCGGFYTKSTFSRSKIAIIEAFIDSEREMAEKYNPNTKILGYQDCSEDGDYTTCYETVSTYTSINSQPPKWTGPIRGGNFSIYRKMPKNCPSNTIYIPGKGCALVSDGYGSIAPSVRNTPAIGNNCKACPTMLTEGDIKLIEAQAQETPVFGNPIDIMSGTKYEVKVDFNFPILFSRNYISNRQDISYLGQGWKHNYERKFTQLSVSDQNNSSYVATLMFKLENDEEVYFSRNSSSEAFIAVFQNHKKFKLQIINSNFILTSPNGNKETYSSSGKLTKIEKKIGYTLNLSYSGNLLSQITDSFGRYLTFEYSNYADVVTKVTSSNGDYIEYSYNSGNIETVSLNSNHQATYGYDANNKLISKKDAKNNLFSVFSYNNDGKAIQTKNALGNSFIHQYTIAYSQGTINVTKGDGGTEQYNYQNVNGLNKINSATLNSSSGSISKNNITYDYKGNITQYRDIHDVYYQYSWDSDGYLETSRKAYQTNTTYVWDKQNNRLISKTEPSVQGTRTIAFTYDAVGNIATKSISSSTAGSRVWSYTWGTMGRILTQTDPTGATVSYGYYYDTDSNINKRGLLHTVTNPLGQITTINDYDIRGNATSVTMANGVVKTMLYDDRSNLVQEQTGPMITYYTYDADNLLLTTVMPNGYSMTFTYDQIHRMVGIADNQGGSLTYTLDDNDLPTSEQLAQNNTLVAAKNKVFDTLGRIKESWNYSSNEKYTWNYNNSIFPTSQSNPNQTTGSMSYSEGMPMSINNLGNGQSMTYDADKNMIQRNVNGLNYNSTYNDFGEMLTSSSPNTGTDSYSYNLQQRQVVKADAKGTVHTHTYDALGRIESVSHTNGSTTETENFVNDTNFVGGLTSASNASSSLTYQYNSLGLLTQKSQNAGGNTKSVNYGYDNAGQLSIITYPSGLIITHGYSNGKLSSLSASGTVTQNILSSISSMPFNGTTLGWTWGNSQNRYKSLDLDGKVTGVSDSGVLNQTYTVDSMFNITSLTNSGQTKTYEYDNANRLSIENKPQGVMDYRYQQKGDRIFIRGMDYTNFNISYYDSKIINYMNSNYNYFSFNYDFNGNPIQITNNSASTHEDYGYDLQNNLASYNYGPLSFTYQFNALGERIVKQGNSVTTTFIYNENHQLIGEYDGTNTTEYVYLNDIPVAVVKNGTMYYIHTDHINTPRVVTTTSNQIVWKWDNDDAFGNNPAQALPLEFNLRFSGQYFDNENNLHYNYYRTYDPKMGRYLQSDPIGLNGGLNTYAYVNGNPLNGVDPLGLLKRDISGNLIFSPYGYSNGLNTITKDKIKYLDGYLYTDKGNKVIAYKRIGNNPSGFEHTADCHGWTFANGKYWIDNEQVMQILNDEYSEVSIKNIQDGDAIIYLSNGKVDHSLTARKTSNGIEAYGKSGFLLPNYLVPIGDGWRGYTDIKIFRKK